MKIGAKSWVARVYAFNYRYSEATPMQTDLCHLCRVVFLYVPLKILYFCALITVAIGGIVYGAYKIILLVPVEAWVSCVALILTIWVGNRLDERMKKRRTTLPRRERQPSVMHQWYKAKKQKICPFVEIVEE